MMIPNFYTKREDGTADYEKFIFEPLPFSFGHSLGNALRRTLLSSLTGASITQIKIEGAPHLFSTLKGVKESVLDIVLNLKQLRFKTPGEGSFRMTIEVKGRAKVSAKDMKGEAEVINTDVYIGEITDEKGKLEIEAIVETGVGYAKAEDVEKKESGFIPVDAFFSPVKRVNFKVEEARVGRETNYDRLILEMWTDGSVAPEKALRDATSILAEHFSHILSGKDVPVPQEQRTEEKEQEEFEKKYNEIIIDELNLPSRVINALLRENIETVSDLIKVGREALMTLKGLGKKSIHLIDDELKKMDIELV